MTIKSFKCVLLGDSGVGKTTLLKKFSSGTFGENTETTTGAAFTSYSTIFNNEIVTLNIWDTAGQERYKSLVNLYTRGASVIILALDLTKSLENQARLEYWMRLIDKSIINKVNIYIVGTKYDLACTSDCLEFNDLIPIDYPEIRISCKIMTSARINMNINELFAKIISGVHDEIEPEIIVPIIVHSGSCC